jgi:hypothetical protein
MRLVAAALGVALLIAFGCAGPGSGSLVILRVYDRNGELLTWDEFRAVQSNGAGEDGENDALLDPSDLVIIQSWPLFDRAGGPALRYPGRAALLALAWPSADGYSQLLLPVPPPGTYSLNLLAAEAAAVALHELQAGHPGVTPSPEASQRVAAAAAALDEARRTADEAAAAVLASHSYDAAVGASIVLLQQYGQQRAGHLRRGATLDRVPSPADLQRVVDLTGRDGWVRLVLDPGTPVNSYAGPIRAAHALGLKVLLEPVDSSAMGGMGEAAWRRRWQSVVTALPEADEWETGNEVNGDWLGRHVADRVAWATRYVHEHTDATALVTLYWQLGEGEPENALFNWLSEYPEAVAEADTIGLSLYPEEHPLGGATDRVLRQLNRVLPDRPLIISELGYGAEDLDHIWWWGAESDPEGAGRAGVAALYTRAIAAYDFGGGGPFWWYFLHDATAGSELVRALKGSWAG